MGEKQLLKSPGTLIAVLVAAALGVAGLGIYLALRPSSTSQSSSLPPSPTVEQSATITALGRLEPEGEVVRVAAPSTSGSAVPVFGSPRVARLLVQERGQVKAGQPIAVLDVYDRLMAAALQSQAQVQEAQSRLAQVQAGAKRGDIAAQQSAVEASVATVLRLEAELKKADLELRRYTELRKDGAITQQELDNRSLTYATASQEVERARRERNQARATLNSVAEVRPTDVQQAQASVNVAMAGIQRAKADLESAVVRSPITGQIIKVHAREGEQIGSDGLVEIGKTDRMYAVAEIYETDIQKVKRGQKAVITSPAFSGEISGVVDQIGLAIRKNDVLNTDPAANTDVRVVEVKIRLDDSQPVSGLTNLQVKVTITP
ncbi:ABC exporter membrane fusion protein [Leptolyngbyaceae cyanobacterium UHCC 1019]